MTVELDPLNQGEILRRVHSGSIICDDQTEIACVTLQHMVQL